MDADTVRRPPFGSSSLIGERGSDTRRRILAAALEVFAEVPFAEARVDLITDRAGCSRPAFYQYFSSKDDAFWALATHVGREMVDLTEHLGPVTADAAGLDHLTAWVERFMAMHEAWAPIFSTFPAASRERAEEAKGSGDISGSTARALLEAFGVQAGPADRSVAQALVAVLIRCSYYAEHAPEGMDRTPLAGGVARVVHRTLAGPIDGTNVRRGRPQRRARVAVLAYEPAPSRPPLPPRNERTRRLLLDAGATVLPARGYHETRVDDVVAQARLSHGTFYRYFANKDDFFRELAEEASARMIEHVDRLDLAAPPAQLRAWLEGWFDAYRDDGGVISTWQEMRTSDDLRQFSQRVGSAVFSRLERALDRRDFGQPVVDASTLLALIERGPHSVYTLGFHTREEGVDAMVTIIRRGFLAVDT